MEKLIVYLLLMLFPLGSAQASDAWKEEVKTLKKVFAVSRDRVKTLQVSNVYGNINISNWDKPEIVCEVQIKAMAESGKDITTLLDKADVLFGESGDRYSVETRVRSGNSGKNQRLMVNIQIYKPIWIPMDLANKYGDISVQGTDQPFVCHIEYGALRTGNLESRRNQITSSYGSVQIEQAAEATISLKYSALSAKMIGRATVTSGYSDIRVDASDELYVQTRYGNCSASNVGRIASVTADYAHVSLDGTLENISARVKYGKVDLVLSNEKFTSVDVEASYTGVSLSVPENSSFKTDLETKYANISISKKFDHSKLDIEKDNFLKRVSGVIGKERAPGRSVRIRNQYSNITLW